ncbi:MAG: hypothetical protein ABEK12_01885, partial [Candidatus Nanohaloarchaea archaeon]
AAESTGAVEEIRHDPRPGRIAIGIVLLLLGGGATAAPTDRWLAGLLALAVGATITFEEIGRF